MDGSHRYTIDQTSNGLAFLVSEGHLAGTKVEILGLRENNQGMFMELDVFYIVSRKGNPLYVRRPPADPNDPAPPPAHTDIHRDVCEMVIGYLHQVQDTLPPEEESE